MAGTIVRHMFCLLHSRSTTASGFRNCRTWAVKSSYCGRRRRCSNGSPRIILISKTICQQTTCYSFVSIKKTLRCAVQTPLPTCHIMPQIHHTRSAIWHFRTSCHGDQLSDFSKLKRDVMMHMRCTWFCHSLESSSCCNWFHLGSSNACANAGSSFGGKSISPLPSFSSLSSLPCANPLSCASPHPSVNVGDAANTSSVNLDEYESVTIGEAAGTSITETAHQKNRRSMLWLKPIESLVVWAGLAWNPVWFCSAMKHGWKENRMETKL